MNDQALAGFRPAPMPNASAISAKPVGSTMARRPIAASHHAPSAHQVRAAPRKGDTKLSASETDTGIPRPSPVSGDGDQVLMNETPPFRGISSATRFRNSHDRN